MQYEKLLPKVSQHFFKVFIQVKQGEVTTLAGSVARGYIDGIGKTAQFYSPYGLYFDDVQQSLLVCDSGNNKLRRVSLNGN